MLSSSPLPTFQSTLPRRERLSPWFFMLKAKDFNPRSREGSDAICQSLVLPCLYFNPRSREGSDLLPFVTPYAVLYFNPRSREGSDVS